MAYYETPTGEVYELDCAPVSDDWTKIPNKEGKERQREKGISDLRSHIDKAEKSNGKPVVYTILRHVSASGMQRAISPVVVINGTIVDISHICAYAFGEKLSNHGGLKVTGCGMDMGWHLAERIMSLVRLGQRVDSFSHRWL